MPQEAEEGRRFAQDMRRIREARNLTVGDLHDETKIPLGLIEAFEETALFNHPQFNRVYLRSFVRTYAHVVGIDADVAMEALEEALSSRYAGSLAVEYLGEELKESSEDLPPVSPPYPPSVKQPAPEGEAPAIEAPTESPEGRTSTTMQERREEEIEASTSQAPAGAKAERGADADEGRPAEEWSAQSPPPGSHLSDRTRTAAPTYGANRLDRRWAIGGAMVVVLAIVAWIVVGTLAETDQEPAQPVATADTAQTVETLSAPAAAQPPVEIPVLGDSMNVQVVAVNGRVDPIRVTVDDDLRRPYWIEQGDSMTFRPTQRIVLEDLLDQIALSLEGIEYPTSRRDDRGRIVITRDSALAYFATLQGGQ